MAATSCAFVANIDIILSKRLCNYLKDKLRLRSEVR